MNLELHRIILHDKATIGDLMVDGQFECHTLEDVVRADGVKIWGETAIPAGTYRVILNFSNRFQKIMPRLMDVPSFTGILIHKGNTSEDTHGCILVGSEVAGPDLITHSTEAFNKLYAKFDQAIQRGESIVISITNDFLEAV